MSFRVAQIELSRLQDHVSGIAFSVSDVHLREILGGLRQLNNRTIDENHYSLRKWQCVDLT